MEESSAIRVPFLGRHGRHPFHGDFCDEGLLIDSFTPLESITNDLSSNTGNTTILQLGDYLERIVDCNRIPTLPVEFKAIRVKELSMAPTKLDDLKAKVHDDLKDVNLGLIENQHITYIGSKLESS